MIIWQNINIAKYNTTKHIIISPLIKIPSVIAGQLAIDC
jgi:hypothetical protein